MTRRTQCRWTALLLYVAVATGVCLIVSAVIARVACGPGAARGWTFLGLVAVLGVAAGWPGAALLDAVDREWERQDADGARTIADNPLTSADAADNTEAQHLEALLEQVLQVEQALFQAGGARPPKPQP